MSWIKYNYYINNVSKDYDDCQARWNSGRLHNTTRTATGATRSVDLLVKEFLFIFSFWAAGENSKVEYTYGWYSSSAGKIWYAKVIPG
jgi:hypothetical protein